jgi:hypothetical protein
VGVFVVVVMVVMVVMVVLVVVVLVMLVVVVLVMLVVVVLVVVVVVVLVVVHVFREGELVCCELCVDFSVLCVVLIIHEFKTFEWASHQQFTEIVDEHGLVI